MGGGATILVQMGDITDREPDSLKIVRNLQQLQREAPHRGGKVFVVLGNHEAMNLLGDNRYTTAGEYAAFADSQSAARRDRVYDVNRATRRSFAKAQDPKLTPEQIRAKWMAEHPLGWVEHSLAWGPSGELGKWATRATRRSLKIGDTLFAHGGISAEYAKLPLDAVNQRVAAAMAAGDDSPASVLTDPLGPLWYRGLVDRRRCAGRPRRDQAAGAAAHRRSGAQCRACRLRREAAGHRAHAEPQGHPDHRQWPAGTDRYRQSPASTAGRSAGSRSSAAR